MQAVIIPGKENVTTKTAVFVRLLAKFIVAIVPNIGGYGVIQSGRSAQVHWIDGLFPLLLSCNTAASFTVGLQENVYSQKSHTWIL